MRSGDRRRLGTAPVTMFPKLDLYQQEAYWGMLGITKKHMSSVPLRRRRSRKDLRGSDAPRATGDPRQEARVVLFAPKAVKDSVWTPEIRQHLAHIGGVAGSADFSNLSVFSHTDLTRTGDFPERFERITELADAVVIDEAHHFRNRGSYGPIEGDDEWDGFDRRLAVPPPVRTHRGRPNQGAVPPHHDADQQLAQRLPQHGRAVRRGQEDYFARTIGVKQPLGTAELHHPRAEEAPRGRGRRGHRRRRRGRGDAGGRREPSSTSSFSEAVRTHGRARSRSGARPPRSRPGPAKGGDLLVAQVLREAARPGRRGVRAQEPALLPRDVLPVGVLPGTQQGDRPVRERAAEAGRRPDPHQLPQAVRELSLHVATLLRPSDAQGHGIRRRAL